MHRKVRQGSEPHQNHNYEEFVMTYGNLGKSSNKNHSTNGNEALH